MKDEENLWEASENGNISVVKELLSIGLLDINCVLFYPNVKTTPLIVAAKKGHQDVVQLLLDHGTEIDNADKSRWTPLSHAANSGHRVVVKLLLKRGADHNKLKTSCKIMLWKLNQ